jgi:hypothetical protein
VVASPVAVTATAILVQDLQALAVAAAALGLPQQAANYTALSKEVAAAFQQAFWSASSQSYVTQCAAGMALLLGITPPEDTAAAQSYLLQDVLSRGNVSTSGEIGNRYALLALGAMGPPGIAAVWASLLRKDAPGYGWMLVMGETALAESWTDSPSDSHLHAMYGHVDEFLFTYVAGIQGTGGAAAGRSGCLWDSVRLAPAWGLPGLSWLNVSFDSPRGLISVAFEPVPAGAEDGAELQLTVQLPPGVQGELLLPRSGARVPLVGGATVSRRD